jgi:hypothetical protein
VQYAGGDRSKGVVLKRDICMWPEVSQMDTTGAFACRTPQDQ